LAEVLKIFISKSKDAERESVREAVFVSSEGVEGDDLHKGSQHAASFLADESLKRIAERGVEGFCTRRFYANIVTQGVSLFDLQPGDKFTIGEAGFAIKKIGKFCFKNKDCAIYNSPYDCVLHNEAVFADILEGGTVRVGDEIVIP